MSFLREHIIKRTTRSSGWRKVRNIQIENYPECAICEKNHSLEAHHNIPFAVDPSLELDPANLTTLCSKCHFLFGHCNYWRAYNAKLIQTICFMKSIIQGRKSI